MKKTVGFSRRNRIFILILSAVISLAFVQHRKFQLNKLPELINLKIPPLTSLNSADPEALGDFNFLTIPLKRAGRLLLIEAVIDGEKGNLVFDTGATGLVLNKTYFRNHTCVECGPSNGITGSTGNISNTVAREVRISDLYYSNIKADVTDLSHIENRRGVKIIGLLGLNMIRSFEILIDANHNELQLHRVDRKGNRVQLNDVGINMDYIQKIDPWHPVIIVKGQVGDKTLNFCFDTGAETNAVSRRAPKTVLNSINVTRRSELKGAGQVTEEVLYGTMNDFRFDKTALPDMETIVVNLDALSEVYGVRIDGMLGYSFLEKGIITINLVKKQFGIQFSKPAV